MDHETAIRVGASEQYILGKLSPSARDDFEEHMADCSACFDDVAALDGFAANANAVFADRSKASVTPAKQPGWFSLPGWASMPAFAFSGGLNLALVAVLGYSFLHVIPELNNRVSQSQQPVIQEAFRLAGNTRGTTEVFRVKSAGGFAVLRFDNPDRRQSFSYNLEGNGIRRSGELASSPSEESLHMIIPVTGLRPGDYRFTLAATQGPATVEMGRCTIRIEP